MKKLLPFIFCVTCSVLIAEAISHSKIERTKWFLLNQITAGEKLLKESLEYQSRTILCFPNLVGADSFALSTPATLETDAGLLIVACGNIKKYEDGYIFSFAVVNSLSVHMNGLKATLEYGATTLERKTDKEISSIAPGSFNKVNAFLPNTRPDDLAIIVVSLNGPSSVQ